MAGTDGTCEYVLDPDDPETWGGEEGQECLIDEELLNDDGVWSCPHEAEEGQELCIFHLPVDEKGDEEVVEAFLHSIENTASNTQRQKSQFLAAKFGEFKLGEPEVEECQPDFSGAGTEVGISMLYATVTGELRWSELPFSISCLCCAGVKFLNSVSLFEVDFRKRVDFSGVDFGEWVSFSGIEFGRQVDFSEAKFEGRASFSQVEFGGLADFSGAKFEERADFGSVNFGRDARFSGVEFRGQTSFLIVNFTGQADFGSAEFEKEADFSYANFRGKVTLRRVEFDEKINFRDAVFTYRADFTGRNLHDSQFNNADLTDVAFVDASLISANLESALLKQATLLSADLRGAKLSGTVLRDVQINQETQFLEYYPDDNDSSTHAISAARSQPFCVYDPKYQGDNVDKNIDKAQSVYQTLEDLGEKHARPQLQRRSFIRRQELQKHEYRRTMFGKKNEENPSWRKRLIASIRYSRAKVAQMIPMYDENQ